MTAARVYAATPGVFAGACMASGDLLVPATRPLRLCDFHDQEHDVTVPYAGGAGWSGIVFPSVASIPDRLPPGSVWVETPTHSGHGWPPDVTPRMWRILSGWVGPT